MGRRGDQCWVGGLIFGFGCVAGFVVVGLHRVWIDLFEIPFLPFLMTPALQAR